MSGGAGNTTHFFIGWDVGGWNCDKNRASRDALVILDSQRTILGQPWRGNLRTTINDANTGLDWVTALFALCRAELPAGPVHATLAIDTPLGFSDAFRRLLVQGEFVEPIGHSDNNPYLFRATEHFLFNHGLRPLSAIKDMIGSQATKGLHVLAKFVPKVERCGVWTDDDCLTAIEAYPSACKDSAQIQTLLRPYAEDQTLDHQDKRDALTCALLAHAFHYQPETLAEPPADISTTEGWIWVPQDALRPAVGQHVSRATHSDASKG